MSDHRHQQPCGWHKQRIRHGRGTTTATG